jgi:hypothetical protein
MTPQLRIADSERCEEAYLGVARPAQIRMFCVLVTINHVIDRASTVNACRRRAAIGWGCAAV